MHLADIARDPGHALTLEQKRAVDEARALVDKTHLAFGNSTHWKEPAYDLISQKVAETILKEKSGN
jgi:hypothetical protein